MELRALDWMTAAAAPPERIERLRDEIGQFRPHVIITHPPTDYTHPDHVATAER